MSVFPRRYLRAIARTGIYATPGAVCRFLGLALALAFPPVLAAPASPPAPFIGSQTSIKLLDEARQRTIPVELYFPPRPAACTTTRPCPVAFLTAGHGIGYKEYTFLSRTLNAMGYLVASVEHQLPSDEAMPAAAAKAVAWRKESFQRGALNLRYARRALSESYAGYDWEHPVLVGHSLGGDISAWTASQDKDFAIAVITLDNRRAALPRGPGAPRVLSIRASDTQPEPGVLPEETEHGNANVCIVKIDGARHNDMFDGGSAELKGRISRLVEAFLRPASAAGGKPGCDPDSSY
jgi:hypothetical protein